MMLTLLLLSLLVQDPVPTDKDGEAAAKKLKEECAKSSIDGKIAAIHEAVKTEHEKVIKAVGELLISEADPVRIAAATALGSVDHPATADVLLNAVQPNLKREDVLAAVLKAMGELGWQTPVGALNQLLAKVGEPEVRAILPEVITTLGQLGSISSIDPLIDLLMKLENGARRNPWPKEGEMRKGGEEALRLITGADVRGAPQWEAWWKSNQDTVRAKATRIYWLKKTQDRVAAGPTEKTPPDAILVASRIHTPATGSTAQAKKKKKNK